MAGGSSCPVDCMAVLEQCPSNGPCVMQEVTTSTVRFYMAVLRPKPQRLVAVFSHTRPRLQQLQRVLQHLHQMEGVLLEHDKS